MRPLRTLQPGAEETDDVERRLLDAGDAPKALVRPDKDGVRLAVARRLPGDGVARVVVAERRLEIEQLDRIADPNDADVAFVHGARVQTAVGGPDLSFPATPRDAGWLAPQAGAAAWTLMSDGRHVWAQPLAADAATALVVVPH